MAQASKHITGTKTTPNRELVTSSGITSLDCILGGGILVGSLVLIEEDTNGSYAKTMLKYFLSEGIVADQKILFASMDTDPKHFVTELPPVVNTESQVDDTERNKIDEEIKIAWRYKNMSPVQSTVEGKSQFGHYFDLGSKINKDTLEKASISLFEPSPQCKEVSIYNELFHFITKEIIENNFLADNTNQRQNLLRIGIESLGSPFWQSYTNETEGKEAADLRLFLKHLKVVLKSANAVAYATVPTHLFEHLGTVDYIRFLADVSIKLDSFAGTPRENNTALKDYHGFFYVPKLAAIKSLVGVEPRIYDLAFKLRRKKFVIEKLHLPPELQESTEREQDDIATAGCGGSHKSALDF